MSADKTKREMYYDSARANGCDSLGRWLYNSTPQSLYWEHASSEERDEWDQIAADFVEECERRRAPLQRYEQVVLIHDLLFQHYKDGTLPLELEEKLLSVVAEYHRGPCDCVGSE
jgi:hypothetical protein